MINGTKECFMLTGGVFIGILITFYCRPLLILDIILIPLFFIGIFFCIMSVICSVLDFLFPNFRSTNYDMDSLNYEDKYDNIENKEIPITGDLFFPAKDGSCVNKYSKACSTCARRSGKNGNYTMGYHCYM